MIHFDNGTEYVNSVLKTHAASKGTTIKTTTPYSPSQNGIAERLNLTIANSSHSMCIAAGLPKMLWPKDVMRESRMPKFWVPADEIPANSRIAGAGTGAGRDQKSKIPARNAPEFPH
jgi:transposase InsO family protein